VDYIGQQYPGWRILQAVDGRDAVRLATKNRPEIVIMDVGLPDMDGIVATRRILAESRRAGRLFFTPSGQQP
jgi:DNA-binding response OmpR family regulator